MRFLLVLGTALGLLGRLLAGEQATAVATVTAGFVTGITVTAGGAGYVSEPAVKISGGGGSGATAKAILAGDKVSAIIVLTAGSSYLSAPEVQVDLPPKATSLSVTLLAAITVAGQAGSTNRIEWSSSASGPWSFWTNVIIGSSGTTLVDFESGNSVRFYRATMPPPPPTLPAGFVWIEPGTFLMGSPASEANRDFDEVQHTVTLTQGFWMSDHETTQAEYFSVMGNNPSVFRGADLPVESVKWEDAALYCQKLTEQEAAAGRLTAGQYAFRLPTEAEWEYACRAGTIEAFYGPLDAIAWYSGNSGGQTHAVKTKLPNAWGLYDMSGNVWEWCSDWYGDYPATNAIDPFGPTAGYHNNRGGGWVSVSKYSRSASRALLPDPSSSLGFRPVLSSVR